MLTDDISHRITSDGYLELSTIHNDRLVRRKYLYKTLPEATRDFKEFLTFIN